MGLLSRLWRFTQVRLRVPVLLEAPDIPWYHEVFLSKVSVIYVPFEDRVKGYDLKIEPSFS